MQIKYINPGIVPTGCVHFPQSDDSFRVAKIIALSTVRGFCHLSGVLPEKRDWVGSKRLWLRFWKEIFVFA